MPSDFGELDDPVIRKNTTREHYGKYQTICLACGISYKDSGLFGSKEELTEKFMEDPNLNNLRLEDFDTFHLVYERLVVKKHKLQKSWSLAENTSLIKHCLYYHVIGAEPVFTDEEKKE